MNSNSDAEFDDEIPIKIVTFSNGLHCLETEKTYLTQQEDAAFSSLHKVEKELFQIRNQDLQTSISQYLKFQ
ncbi:hypothetical protein TNCV_4006391 [Trichonephila clavipes]|nr:hypothetical protein TNCV_4006391 [Trichonephila clavipes]